MRGRRFMEQSLHGTVECDGQLREIGMSASTETGRERAERVAAARRRLDEELAVLSRRRRELAVGLSDPVVVGDRADNAEALQRSDDLAWVDDRITELTDRLAHLDARGTDLVGEPGALPDGTVVTLRFADGGTETLRVVAMTEEIAEGEEPITITTGSPLGRALVGAAAGTAVTYRTPAGARNAEVVEIRLPGSPAH